MKYNAFSFIICLLFGLSCKKLVEIPVDPIGEISTQQVFADSIDIVSAIAGVYNNFQVTQLLTITSGALTTTTGLAGDELIYNQQDRDIRQFFANGLLSDNSQVYELWNISYSSLYQVNACLEGVSTTTGISQAFKQQLIGELEVLRALYYFQMVNLWGGVPIVLSTDYRVNSNLPRASTDSVYGRIIADLTDAATRLTADYPSAGRARPNSYTAIAFLAKVYLYRSQWQQSADAVTRVTGSGLYQLAQDPNTVFLDGSPEAIWQLPAVGQFSQTWEGHTFIPYDVNVVPDYTINPLLKAAFENGDLRLQDWITTTQVNDGSGNIQSYSYPFKYKDRNISAPTTEDYMIFRLADLYLVRAEARAHLGSDQDALADLNVVRARAGLPNSTAASSGDVLAAILHERQTEMFCEWGNRWFDLKRTGTIDNVLGTEKPGWRSTDSLYPVPIRELHTNSLLTQNKGY